MKQERVGFALCGSFCTFRKAIDALRALTAQYTVVPIFSDAAWETDTRFGASADFRAEVTALCGTEPLHTLAQVEPLGPPALSRIFPCCRRRPRPRCTASSSSRCSSEDLQKQTPADIIGT